MKRLELEEACEQKESALVIARGVQSPGLLDRRLGLCRGCVPLDLRVAREVVGIEGRRQSGKLLASRAVLGRRLFRRRFPAHLHKVAEPKFKGPKSMDF